MEIDEEQLATAEPVLEVGRVVNGRFVPNPEGPRLCPSCGSSQLLAKVVESTATRRIDAENSLGISFERMQVNCGDCGFLTNDDVHGTAAIALAMPRLLWRKMSCPVGGCEGTAL